MKRDGGKSGTASRRVTPDEAELWDELAHSIDKVKAKARVPAHALIPPPVRSASAPPKPQRGHTAKGSAAASKAPPAAPLADFDRRAHRHVASGKLAIDARVDLHGLSRHDAHTRLRAFLLGSQAKGHRIVLVITGKGGEAEAADHLASVLGAPQRGVLRRNVPQWLAEPELRKIVLSYASAGVRHGGDGALYVRLRKAREAYDK
jgi:DNA-nicking Smr family endonuclease